MHINRIETGTMKGRGHFNLAVNTLLAQDRNWRAHTGCNQRCRHIVIHFKMNDWHNTLIIHIQQSVEFFACTARVITQGLHLPGCLRPGALQINACFGQYCLSVDSDLNTVIRIRHANYMRYGFQPMCFQGFQNSYCIRTTQLQYRTQLLRKQHG